MTFLAGSQYCKKKYFYYGERKKKTHLILSEIIVNKMCFWIILTLQKGSLLHNRDAGDYSALGF